MVQGPPTREPHRRDASRELKSTLQQGVYRTFLVRPRRTRLAQASTGEILSTSWNVYLEHSLTIFHKFAVIKSICFLFIKCKCRRTKTTYAWQHEALYFCLSTFSPLIQYMMVVKLQFEIRASQRAENTQKRNQTGQNREVLVLPGESRVLWLWWHMWQEVPKKATLTHAGHSKINIHLSQTTGCRCYGDTV